MHTPRKWSLKKKLTNKYKEKFVILQSIGIIVMKSKETRVITYICRYSSGYLILILVQILTDCLVVENRQICWMNLVRTARNTSNQIKHFIYCAVQKITLLRQIQHSALPRAVYISLLTMTLVQFFSIFFVLHSHQCFS